MWESRIAPLSGVLFAALLVISFVADPNTDFMPPADEVVAYLTDSPLRIMLAAYLRLLAAAALIWFSGSLYKSLRDIDDDGGRLSLLAFAGGVVGGALIAVGATAIGAAAERMWMRETIDTGAAAGLFDLAGILIGNGAPLGLAVMIGATGTALLRTPGSKRWAGWGSAVLGLGLLSPYSWLLLAGAAVWIPVVGVWTYRRESRPTPVGVS